jgi:hypothetical protein
MSLKENLQKKIRIKKVKNRIASTLRETPGQRRLNKEAMRDLLELSDFEQIKKRDLTLYVRPLEKDLEEILVFDNELPIYHSTVADVAMRKTPQWKEMLSVRNVIKVLNDKDVVVSRGKESLNRVYENALAGLDLTYSKDDLDRMFRDAQRSLNQRSLAGIQESMEMFVELLGLQPVSMEVQEPHIQSFARLKVDDETAPLYEDVIYLDEHKIEVHLLKGEFAARSDWDLARFLRCVHGEASTDAQDEQVFEYLVELASAGQTYPQADLKEETNIRGISSV